MTSCLLRRLLGGDSKMTAAVSGASAGGLSMALFYRSKALTMYAAWKTLEVGDKLYVVVSWLCQMLKIGNHELQFFLLVHEMRN